MGRTRRTDKHLPKNVYLKSGSYYLVARNYTTGKLVWTNLGRDFTTAMARYGQLAAVDHCETMSDLIDRYTAEISPTKAVSTYKTELRQAKLLRAAFGRMRPARVTPQDIYKYLDARGKTAPIAANREFALLSNMFTKAIRWGELNANPCVRIEKHKETPRKRYITDAEFEAFRVYAGDLIGRYMDFKYLTGLRKGDILRLHLSDLREDGIHVHISKTGKDMVIRWSDALNDAVDAVRALKRPVTGLHLFCTRRGQPYTVNGFSAIWKRKMRKALEEGIIAERFTEHDIRAKTGSDAKKEHATELLAHSDAATTERSYRRKAAVVTPLK